MLPRRVSGGEQAQVGVSAALLGTGCLAVTHILLADFGVVEPAGEYEVIVERAGPFEDLTEGTVGVVLLDVDGPGLVVVAYYPADGAEAVLAEGREKNFVFFLNNA